jgi:hypothetical protein
MPLLLPHLLLGRCDERDEPDQGQREASRRRLVDQPPQCQAHRVVEIAIDKAATTEVHPSNQGGGKRRALEPWATFGVPVPMVSRAETYEKKAAECEREGDHAATPALKSKYRGVAQQWREMAEQTKRAASRKPKKVHQRRSPRA